MARILITGGSGLLAINWASQLCMTHSIFLVMHERKISMPGVNIVNLELVSTTEIERVLNNLEIDLVIHAAAITSIEICENNPGLANFVNVNLAKNISIASAALGIKLVHISTDHLFDDSKILFSETDSVSPINTYAKTKAEAEKKVILHNPESLVIRTNFYGWGSSYRHSFSDYILKALVNKCHLKLFEDVFYTPILIETLVSSVHGLIELDEFGIFNVVGNERLSKFEFGKKLAPEFNLDDSLIVPISISSRNELVNRPREMGLSNQKLCNVLGKNFGFIEAELSKLHKQICPRVDEIGCFEIE